jgi:hypothetical protein
VIGYEAAKSDTGTDNLYVALRITRDSRKNIHDFRLLAPANQDERTIQEGDEFAVAPIEIVKVPLECVKIVYATRARLPSSLRGEKEFNFLYVLFNVSFSWFNITKLIYRNWTNADCTPLKSTHTKSFMTSGKQRNKNTNIAQYRTATISKICWSNSRNWKLCVKESTTAKKSLNCIIMRRLHFWIRRFRCLSINYYFFRQQSFIG